MIFAGGPRNLVLGGFWQTPGPLPLPRKGCSITPECSGKCSGVFPIVSHGLGARGSVFIGETQSHYNHPGLIPIWIGSFIIRFLFLNPYIDFVFLS